jgi:hypothetical protein
MNSRVGLERITGYPAKQRCRKNAIDRQLTFVYLSRIVTKASQQFEFLAAQFEAIAHNLSACQEPGQRWELLRGMLGVIVELDRLLSTDMSWLDSLPASIIPIHRPLVMAAHR